MMRGKWKALTKRQRTVVATAAFILLAAAFTYAAVRLIGGAVYRELEKAASRGAGPTPAATASPPAETTEPSQAAMQPLVPQEAQPTPTPVQEAEQTLQPDQSALPSQTPTPAFQPFTGRFDETRKDFLFVGYDEAGSPDCIALVQADEEGCTLLFIPRNTLSAWGRKLSTYRNDRLLAEAVSTVVPVSVSRWAHMELKGVSDLVDAAGGVTCAGETLLGDAAYQRMLCPDADEMIRTATHQTLLASYFSRVRTLGLVRLAATKAALNRYAGGNITTAQYLALYRLFITYRSEDITWRTLPVDSVTSNGQRCYQADAALTGALARELFE